MKSRVLTISAILTLAAGAGIASIVGGASAAPTACPNPAIQTSKGSLTVWEVNPGNVTTPVDAHGCQVAVYYDSTGTGGTVSAAISNATYYGVFVDAADGNVAVDVTGASVSNIGDSPFNGAQHGVAIYYNGTGTGTASGSVSNTSITQYQKNGIVVSGANAHVDVSGNTVTGLGPVDFIAQNGIQFSFGATGSVTGNTISDNWYTGCSNQDAAKTGNCIPYVSTGLLLFDVNPAAVKASRNMFRDNQRNQYVYTSAQS